MSATIHEFPHAVSDLAEARRAVDELKMLILARAPFEELSAVLDAYAAARRSAAGEMQLSSDEGPEVPADDRQD